jgi:hypothetical protein
VLQASSPVRGICAPTTVTGIDWTTVAPVGEVPVRRTWWAPAVALIGMRTLPLATPAALAVSVPMRTGVDRKSTATVLFGAKPPPVTVTSWPGVGVASLIPGACVGPGPTISVELVLLLPGTVDEELVLEVDEVELVDEELVLEVDEVELVDEELVLEVDEVELVDEELVLEVDEVELLEVEELEVDART